ncbi:MAG: replication initiation protein [Nanoarchaeota archaeon]
MEKTETTLAQSNLLTQARYDYSKIEKRAVYFIIQQVRKQFVEVPDGQRDLFNDLVVKMSTKSLQRSESRLEDIYRALRSLRKKDLFIKDDEQVLCVGYINYFRHKIGDEELEVQVSHKILPYLVELAEQFTSYKLIVAISLKNKYSQRFYEYCSQFKRTGFMPVKVSKLREQMMLENKYPRYALLKRYVIEPAQKELEELYNRGECDLYFTYKEHKKGRTVHQIDLFIHWNGDEGESGENVLKLEDQVFHIRNWLFMWLSASKRPKNKRWIDKVIKHINLNTDLIPKLYNRLNDLVKKEPNKNHAALARHIIEEDFLPDE